MSGTMMTIIPLILLIAVMYFLMIRPQKKRERETTAMRNSVQVGDEIVTIGGICGKIVKTKDETIIIQVGADKVKFEMMRWSISKVVKEGKNHNKETADDYEEMSEAEEKVTNKGRKAKRLKKAAPEVEEDVQETVETVEEAPAAAEEAVEETAAEAAETAEAAEEAAAETAEKEEA